MTDLVPISNAAADAGGASRLLVLACAVAESRLNPTDRRPSDPSQDTAFWPDVSGGAWQQAVRWDPEYHGDGSYPGPEEVERILQLQYDPERSARLAAANLRGKYRADEPDAVFRALCRYNWPAGGGQPASAAVEADYRYGIEEAQRLLGVTTVGYNPNVPLILQNDDWSCWDTSARMGAESLGRHPSEAWFERQSIADGIESTAVGLEDGSGATAAAWLARQYGNPAEGTPTLRAYNDASATFDEVKAVAGTTAVLLGGHHWGGAGHWTFVRRYDAASDSLTLGNPAGTYGGIGQTMSREQFAQVSPCSMVVMLANGATVAETDPAADPRDQRIAELEVELADARSQLGVASVDYANGLETLVAALRKLNPAA